MDHSYIDEDFSLEKKVTMITGAATGIGKSIAQVFAKKGSDLILIDLDKKVEEVAAKLEKTGIRTLAMVCDITIPESIESIINRSLEEFKKIDILVNNAGVGITDDIVSFTREQWDKTIAVNLSAHFFMSQAVGREMIKRKYGKIINLASQAGIVALDKHVAYSASKAALISITKVCALEWSKYNINVNAISPTVTLTEMGKKHWTGKVGDEMKKKIPMGRFAQPEEIAMAALFLASDNSNMISGENIVIDGGYTIM